MEALKEKEVSQEKTIPSEALMKCRICSKEMIEPFKGKNRCKECTQRYFREKHIRNREHIKEKYREYNKTWRRNNRKVNSETVHAKEKAYREKRLEMNPEEVRAYHSLKTKEHRKRLKEEVYMAYGGFVCACCGETEVSFLSIDHMNNDGYAMRKIHGNSDSFYNWLKKNKFPKGFQILCMNCQFGKKNNHGVCPHQGTCDGHPKMGVGSSDPKRSKSNYYPNIDFMDFFGL
jgi:hypothetical protein